MGKSIQDIGIRIGMTGAIFILIKVFLSLFLTKTSFYINNLEIPFDFYFLQITKQNLLIISCAFTLVLFLIINKNKLLEYKVPKLNHRQLVVFLILSLTSLTLHYALKFFINKNLDFTLQAAWFWGTIKLLLNVAFTVFLFLAFIQLKYTAYLINLLKEKKWFIATPVVIYIAMFYFQKLWPFFSGTVAKLLSLLLKVFYPNTLFIPSLLKGQGPIISTQNFTVQIGSPCSGIDSLLMFTALYIIIFALDKNKIKMKQYWAIFPIGLVGMYLFNVLRLFLLMLVGIHISPQFAEGLFHQNIGWILFIIYFFLWNKITDKLVYKK